MINKKALFILLIVLQTLNSCLVPLAPKYHYFISTNNIEEINPKVTIFSTPRYKYYVVTNVDMTSPWFVSQVTIYLLDHDKGFLKFYFLFFCYNT